MTLERWAQIEELFHRAVECDPRRRASLLDEACNGDSELRREVDALLASEETASDDMQAAVRYGLDAATFPLVDEIISHYRILDGLGGGGMGSVYRAEDIKLGRQVALKFLPEESTKNPTALHRFEREARAASALEHPNICPIYEFGEHEGQPFLAMQLLKGQTLREVISTPDRRRVPLPVDKLLDLAIQIASGLEAAHSCGIIHRDIKPANIFVTTQGQAIILDFGLAKLFHSEAIEDEGERTPHELATGKMQASWKVIRAARDPLVSLTGAAIGTAGYMSPEQLRGDMLDARTDLFSFGAVLYEMATGKMAFFGNTAAKVNEAITEGTPTLLTRMNPDMPSELERIVNKSLEKEARLRYQNAAEIRMDLQRLKSDADLDRAPRTTQIESKSTAKSNRFPWVATTVATALIIALVAGGRLFFYRDPHALTEKDTIILADFTNETGDPVFDHTLREGLAVELEQSPFISLVSEPLVQQTLKLMGLPPDARLNPEVAREVCQRTQGTAVLAGAIWQIGTRYNLVLKAISCATGKLVASTQTEASDKSHVLDALGKATSQIRKRLGESLSSVEKLSTPLEQATTASLEALQSYTLARKQVEKGAPDDALPFLKRAVELDPNFALAYASLSIYYANKGDEDLSTKYAMKAYDLRSNVSERERLSISMVYFTKFGELEKEIETLKLMEQTYYPRDPRVLAHLGSAYERAGELPRSLEERRAAVSLDSETPQYRYGLGAILLLLGNLDEAKSVFEETIAKKTDNMDVHIDLYRIAHLRNDALGMQREVKWAAGKPDEFRMLQEQSEMAMREGRLETARELLGRANDLAARRNLNRTIPEGTTRLAGYRAVLGDCHGFPKQVSSEKQASPMDFRVAIPLALCGYTRQADELIEQARARFPQDTFIQAVLIPAERAAIAIHNGNPDAAIEFLHSAAPYENRYPVVKYVRGLAYLQAHKAAGAASEFQRILDQGPVLSGPFEPLARVGLARAYALQGDTANAKAAYQDFLTFWKDADPGIPLLRQAKVEYKKLQ